MKFNKLLPELLVSNLENSLAFYTKILNFKVEFERPESKFVFLSYNGSQIMIQEITGTMGKPWITGKMEHPFGRGINFQIETKELSEIVQSLKKNKHRIEAEPYETVYKIGNEQMKMIEIMVMDPDGYLLRFSQEIDR